MRKLNFAVDINGVCVYFKAVVCVDYKLVVLSIIFFKGGDFLNPQQLEITDIFRSAYLLCSGADLDGIRFKSNGKRIALFMIKGDKLDELDRDYRSGQALVNPLKLRESLNHLRDILFEKLREREARTRNDRKRKERKPCPEYRMRRYSV